ncbi:hypothetical protein [Morganella morganii]|uniref:hypothetical protein n=1 Tax=Morganella morganii TaxID=582 RepID=UPI0018996735|nr:hypothetical protein [Morganella morganii]
MFTIGTDDKYNSGFNYIEMTASEAKALAMTKIGCRYQNALIISKFWRYAPKNIATNEPGTTEFMEDIVLGEKFYFIVFCVDNHLFYFFINPKVSDDGKSWTVPDNEPLALAIEECEYNDIPAMLQVQGLDFPGLNIA